VVFFAPAVFVVHQLATRPDVTQGEQNTMLSSKAIKKSRRFFWYLFGRRA
jgi:hypothetical protein